jgi:hypothetical protein
MYIYAIPVVVVGTPDTATNVMLSYAKRATKRKPKQLLPGGSTHPDKTWPTIVPSQAIMGQIQRLCLEDPKGEHWLAGSTLSQVGSIEVHKLLLKFLVTTEIFSDMQTIHILQGTRKNKKHIQRSNRLALYG